MRAVAVGGLHVFGFDRVRFVPPQVGAAAGPRLRRTRAVLSTHVDTAGVLPLEA